MKLRLSRLARRFALSCLITATSIAARDASADSPTRHFETTAKNVSTVQPAPDDGTLAEIGNELMAAGVNCGGVALFYHKLIGEAGNQSYRLGTHDFTPTMTRTSSSFAASLDSIAAAASSGTEVVVQQTIEPSAAVGPRETNADEQVAQLQRWWQKSADRADAADQTLATNHSVDAEAPVAADRADNAAPALASDQSVAELELAETENASEAGATSEIERLGEQEVASNAAALNLDGLVPVVDFDTQIASERFGSPTIVWEFRRLPIVEVGSTGQLDATEAPVQTELGAERTQLTAEHAKLAAETVQSEQQRVEQASDQLADSEAIRRQLDSLALEEPIDISEPDAGQPETAAGKRLSPTELVRSLTEHQPVKRLVTAMKSSLSHVSDFAASISRFQNARVAEQVELAEAASPIGLATESVVQIGIDEAPANGTLGGASATVVDANATGATANATLGGSGMIVTLSEPYLPYDFAARDLHLDSQSWRPALVTPKPFCLRSHIAADADSLMWPDDRKPAELDQRPETDQHLVAARSSDKDQSSAADGSNESPASLTAMEEVAIEISEMMQASADCMLDQWLWDIDRALAEDAPLWSSLQPRAVGRQVAQWALSSDRVASEAAATIAAHWPRGGQAVAAQPVGKGGPLNGVQPKPAPPAKTQPAPQPFLAKAEAIGPGAAVVEVPIPIHAKVALENDVGLRDVEVTEDVAKRLAEATETLRQWLSIAESYRGQLLRMARTPQATATLR